MAKQKNFVPGKKNSKPTNKPQKVEVVKKDKIKLTPDTSAVLTVYFEGAFKCRHANAGTKEQKRKIRMSPLLMENKEGKWTKQALFDVSEWFTTKGWRKLAPGEKIRNYFEGPKTYEEFECHECSVNIPLNAATLQYYASEDSRPYYVKAEDWKAKSKMARIHLNADITAADAAGGKQYRYELSFLN